MQITNAFFPQNGIYNAETALKTVVQMLFYLIDKVISGFQEFF